MSAMTKGNNYCLNQEAKELIDQDLEIILRWLENQVFSRCGVIDMEEAVVVNTGDDQIHLPAGFRFHPTDEEIITYYLTEKVMKTGFCAIAIGEVDLNKCEPWDLPVFLLLNLLLILLSCERRIWTKHGFFLCVCGYAVVQDEWVVCRIFHKSTGIKKTSIHDLRRMNSIGDDFLDYSSLPPLMDPPNYTSRPGTSSFSDADNNEFKAMATPRSSDGNYLANTIMLNNNQNVVQPLNTNYQTPNSSFHLQIPASNPLYTFQTNPNMPVYLHQGKSTHSFPNFQNSTFGNNDQTLLRALAAGENYGESSNLLEKQCKVEQFSSNQSMVSLSPDSTGLSTDVNTATEISSVVSKQEIGSHNKFYENLEDPLARDIADYLWDY
ncbi:hypothetical protein SADUNF_Sadunf13G0045600 [Salix dunnii]|uniref:NAC domain-containing protein n=1 Tax=Salix dunnii TaxID=1413687 RepID=A0A835MN81_9ROSI|nr:hypothetical protein SADUNF_Sadunf13G0045600 [Salix dunnii]